MPKYRKKPVVVEAVQWTGDNLDELAEFMGDSDGERKFLYDRDNNTIKIYTLEGVMTATPGDFIIKGVNGEFYPCKPDIFYQTHEPVEWPEELEMYKSLLKNTYLAFLRFDKALHAEKKDAREINAAYTDLDYCMSCVFDAIEDELTKCDNELTSDAALID